MDGSLNHSEEQFQNNASGDTRGGAWRARPPLNFIIRPNRGLSQGQDDRPASATEGGFGEWSQWFSIRVNERLPSSKKHILP